MKKLLSLLLSVLLILPLFALPSYAAESPDPVAAELSSDTVARVKEEVLTGNITNHEDVLKVALAQYEAATKARTYSRSATPIDENAPLTITQLVDSTTDENGVTIETIAKTSLLVLDENGRSANNMLYRSYHMSNSNGLNQYSVFATHTMFVETRTNDPIAHTETVCVTKMETVLVYGTAMKASGLLHRFACSDEYMDVDGFQQGYYEDDLVTNPSAGNVYDYEPPERWVPRVLLGSFVQTSAEIFVGSTSFTIVNHQTLDGTSTWYLIED